MQTRDIGKALSKSAFYSSYYFSKNLSSNSNIKASTLSSCLTITLPSSTVHPYNKKELEIFPLYLVSSVFIHILYLSDIFWTAQVINSVNGWVFKLQPLACLIWEEVIVIDAGSACGSIYWSDIELVSTGRLTDNIQIQHSKFIPIIHSNHANNAKLQQWYDHYTLLNV